MSEQKPLNVLLDEIEERANKATPGPWDNASNYPECNSVRIFAKSHYIATVGNSDDTKEQTEANSSLIAAARADLPKLVTIAKMYVAELEHLGRKKKLAEISAILNGEETDTDLGEQGANI